MLVVVVVVVVVVVNFAFAHYSRSPCHLAQQRRPRSRKGTEGLYRRVGEQNQAKLSRGT